MDLEGRSRRSHLKLVGFAEGVERDEPTGFIQKWLLDKVITAGAASTNIVERAHRIPIRKLPPGSAPRLLLIKMVSSRPGQHPQVETRDTDGEI